MEYMRNRAKCRLCKSEIESVTLSDVVSCACEEITIWGGLQELRSLAKDYKNFLRLDENGNEIEVKVINKSDEKKEVPVEEEKQPELTREQKVDMVDAMLKYYEDLPGHVMLSNPTQYDMKAVFLMIRQVLT